MAAEEDHRLSSHGGAVLAVIVDDGAAPGAGAGGAGGARRLYGACVDGAVRVWDLQVCGARPARAADGGR